MKRALYVGTFVSIPIVIVTGIKVGIECAFDNHAIAFNRALYEARHLCDPDVIFELNEYLDKPLWYKCLHEPPVPIRNMEEYERKKRLRVEQKWNEIIAEQKD